MNDIKLCVGCCKTDSSYQYKTIVLKNGLSFASQVVEEYRKYIIKWDFDLNGETITIPKNCILEFDGGSVKNGTLIGQDTVFINVGDVEIWGEGLTREGTWREHSGGTGKDGKSAYECYVETVPPGQTPMTEEEWLASLQGLDGARGPKGNQGDPGTVDYSNIYTKSEVNNKIQDSEDELRDEIEDAKDEAVESGRGIVNAALIDYYNKTETNNLISHTPEKDTVVAESLDEITEETIGGEPNPKYIAPEDRANILFRISGNDNTSYSEYGWDGNDFVLLDTKNFGVDDVPVRDSENVMSSKGVAKIIEPFTTSYGFENIKFAIIDKLGNIISYVDNSIFKFLLNISVEKVNNVPAARVIQTEKYKVCFLDELDNVIFAITNDNKLYTSLFNSAILYGNYFEKTSFYDRNRDAERIMINDSLYDYYGNIDNPGPPKRFQMFVVTDTHYDTWSFGNVAKDAGKFISVDALIHLGDMCTWLSDDTYPQIKEMFDKATKPTYFAIGNHDVGAKTPFVKYCKDDKTLYDRFIKPSVNRGYLASGEYEKNKCYYYHDFSKYNIRMIVLYPYDDGNVYDQTYWKPITRGNYELLADNTNYLVGDKVNVQFYEVCSFECVRNVRTGALSSPGGYNIEDYNYTPRFKALRGLMWYGQDQLDWFCDKLEEAGSLGYTTIVCQHHAFLAEEAFCDDSTRFQNHYRTSTYVEEQRFGTKDIISKIIYAYQNKTNVRFSVTPINGTTIGSSGTDDTSSIGPVSINRTFNQSGKVLMLNGHEHRDSVRRSERFNQLNIGFLCGTTFDIAYNDTYRTRNENSISNDTVTAVTVYTEENDNNEIVGKVHLTRLGAIYTRRVDPVTNKLITKDNEVLTF